MIRTKVTAVFFLLATFSLTNVAAANPRRSGDSRVEALAAFLAREGSGYARDNAQGIERAIGSARDVVSRSRNAACRADALAHLDAVDRLLRVHPTSARSAVPATFEVLLRLTACEANASCDVAPDVANATGRVALWLELDAVSPEGGTAATFLHLIEGQRAMTARDHARALEAFNRAAEVATCPRLRADALRRAADAQSSLTEREAARATIDRALALLPASEVRTRADLLMGRGFTFLAARDYPSALAAFAQARGLYAQLGEHGRLLVAWADSILSVGTGELRRFDEAIALNQRALVERIPLLGESHPDVLVNLSNIAVNSARRGDFEGALEAHRRIYDVRRRILEPNDASLAVTLEAMAGILVRRERPNEALPLCERAIEVRNAGDVAVDRPRAYACRANALLALRRPQDALPDAVRAVDLARQAQGPDHRDVAGYLDLLAACAERAGDPQRAGVSRADAARIRALGDR